MKTGYYCRLKIWDFFLLTGVPKSPLHKILSKLAYRKAKLFTDQTQNATNGDGINALLSDNAE